MNDEYEGQGGSYALDPKSGKRQLLERTAEAEPQPPAEAGFFSPVEPVTPVDTTTKE